MNHLEFSRREWTRLVQDDSGSSKGALTKGQEIRAIVSVDANSTPQRPEFLHGALRIRWPEDWK
jgi:hypothetical protein